MLEAWIITCFTPDTVYFIVLQRCVGLRIASRC